MKKHAPIIYSILSGILLSLCFAPVASAALGWLALIPLFAACSNTTPRRAAFLGWLAGAIFFLISLIWLRHVTWIGFIALSFYSALYFIPFAIFIALRPGGWSSMARCKNLLWMAGAAIVWAASEYLRATLLTGFPWNLLAVSQAQQISLIQIAEWGGVYLVSALMVFVNAGLAVTLLQYTGGLRQRGYRIHIELMSAMFLLALSSSFGLRVLLQSKPSTEPVHVALIQPNIPEVGNWDLADPDLIYERLDNLTRLAQRTSGLDLIVWPETALPDCVRYSPRSAAFVKDLCAAGVPILAGSMDLDWIENDGQLFYNASLLFNPNAEILGTYRKQHLVLFGEYIPFEEKIPLVNALTPINSSFTPGRDATAFRLPGRSDVFSVLICFEDTLPSLARRAVRRGADWLINQTNDSWFDPDSGSVQHLAHAIFRSVETRRPMLRCANTGITCSIDAQGRVQQTLAPRTQGFQVVEISPAQDAPLTFYTQYGDVFAQACLLISIAVFIGCYVQTRKKTHA